jgi:nicotinate phosphoribosyltransferase
MEPSDAALATDLYELTMAAAYFENKVTCEGTFELFVRHYPNNRSYLIAAGLQQAVDYLLQLKFENKHIDFLRQHPIFKDVSEDFFQYLKTFRFNGSVWAMPEGTVFFTNEPILQISAPLIEAQIVETYLLSIINFETLIASKAARVVTSARGRGVVEFGARRAHGPESALLAARASYIGGCIGTSNVLAGYRFGIPTYGTVAHSFVMTFDTEREAFERFCNVFPSNPAFLLDTYDTLEAAKVVVSMPLRPSIVRLDSGNRALLSREVRRILDRSGRKYTRIFVSGDLNEYVLDRLTKQKAPIDFFGVGTELVTSRDDPALPGIYKLVALEQDGRTLFRAKTSKGKRTIPAAKQVYRKHTPKGMIQRDLIALRDEPPPRGMKPLLVEVIHNGQLITSLPNLEEIRHHTKSEIVSLPYKFRRLHGSVKPPVRLSRLLEQLTNSLWKNEPNKRHSQ